MSIERKFYYCPHCGNTISFIYDAGPGVSCCGEEMMELKPNTADASREKHVPAVVRDGDKLTVTVGSEPHPMTGAHHIAWIAIAEEDKTQRFVLPPMEVPKAEFTTGKDRVTVYAYCNLHGLWSARL